MKYEPSFSSAPSLEADVDHEQFHPRVLKESEGALFFDGRYLAEVSNIRYPDKRDMFEYDPELGLLVRGQKAENEAYVKNEDVVRLHSHVGHISVAEMFGPQPGIYSNRDWNKKLYEKAKSIENRLEKVRFLATRVFEMSWDDLKDFERCVMLASDTNPQYSTEELMAEIMKYLRQKYEREHETLEMKQFDKNIESLLRTGVLDPEVRRQQEGVVSFFYWYCQVKGIDGTDEEAVCEAIRHFRFYDELMEEFEHKPDIRFGDTLLLACSRVRNENAEV